MRQNGQHLALHGFQRDALHAQGALALFGGRTEAPCTALDPNGVAPESDVLIPAFNTHSDRSVGALAPVLSSTTQLRRAWAEERHGGRAGDTTQVRDSRVRTNQESGGFYQLSQLKKIKTSREALEAA